MNKISRIIATTAIMLILLLTFTSCGLISTNDNDAFDTFNLIVQGHKNKYFLQDTATIIINENKGKPIGYNVYEKYDDDDFQQMRKTSLEKTVPIAFTKIGTYSVKIVPVVGTLEQEIKAITVSFLVAVEMDVTNIELSDSKKGLLLDELYTINYEILPANATDKTVIYEIEEGFEDYLVITEAGEVTVAENYDTLVALTKPIKVKLISNSNSDIFTEIEITIVNIKEEDIEINITTDASFTGADPLFQTIGDLHNVTFELVGLSNYTSEWYLDDITQSVSLSTYMLEFLPIEEAGERQVRVDIALANLSVPVTISREFTMTLESAFTIEPLLEQYQIMEEVELKHSTNITGTTEVLWSIHTSDQGLEISGDTYRFVTAGKCYFRALFLHNGTPIEEKSTETIMIKESITHEMHNVYVNGYQDGTNSNRYAPIIKWFKLGEDTNFTVEIIKNDLREVYTSEEYPEKFTAESFKVPYDDFKLGDSFEYKIKTSISDRFTGLFNYEGTINSNKHSYFDEITDGMSRYIANVYDLGKLINYIQVFRPSSLYKGTVSNGSTYSVDLYFGIDYEVDVDKDAYERDGVIDSANDSGMANASNAIVNASKLITAANRAYGAGIGMGMSYLDIEANGGVTVSLILPEAESITKTMPLDGAEPIIIYDKDYTENPRGGGNTHFPIDANSKTLSVKSSTELYLAASWGRRPIPTTNSVAEGIYNKAKTVLNAIIGDDMSNIEKAHAIYDYLCSEIKYDNSLYDYYLSEMAAATTPEELVALNKNMNQYKSFHLEGVFEEKIAVCDGISKAFVLLCAIEDIPTIKVSGAARNDDGGGAVNHAWNMIMLEGKWYYVDATWGRGKINDGGTIYIGVNHYYISASEELASTHTQDGELPIVASERGRYYYDDFGEDLYFETEEELNVFMGELASQINSSTVNLYIDFVVAYTYTGEIKGYIGGKLPSGSGTNGYGLGVSSKENIVMIYIIIL